MKSLAQYLMQSKHSMQPIKGAGGSQQQSQKKAVPYAKKRQGMETIQSALWLYQCGGSWGLPGLRGSKY